MRGTHRVFTGRQWARCSRLKRRFPERNPTCFDPAGVALPTKHTKHFPFLTSEGKWASMGLWQRKEGNEDLFHLVLGLHSFLLFSCVLPQRSCVKTPRVHIVRGPGWAGPLPVSGILILSFSFSAAEEKTFVIAADWPSIRFAGLLLSSGGFGKRGQRDLLLKFAARVFNAAPGVMRLKREPRKSIRSSCCGSCSSYFLYLLQGKVWLLWSALSNVNKNNLWPVCETRAVRE